MKSILLNLNLDMPTSVLDDYIELHLADMGTDSSRYGEVYNRDQFLALYLLILRNQSSYFRDLYNNIKQDDINMQQKLEENNNNLRQCFEVYDSDHNGTLEYMEIRDLLIEMNCHKQFALHFQPQYAFESFVGQIWRSFDKNQDGKISFEEFIYLFNALMDRW